MRTTTFLIGICLFVMSCSKTSNKSVGDHKTTIKLDYATNFSISHFSKYSKLEIFEPYKNASTGLTYILTSDTLITSSDENTVVIPVPIANYMATSTTQIPVFEAIGVENKLTAFPNLNYISSKRTRQRIANQEIVELGSENNLNIEQILQLEPDSFFAFAINELNKSTKTLKKAGVPIVIDASWLEKTPLGRAEWIKFFAVFFGKERKAKDIFNTIKQNYNKTLDLVKPTSKHPKILSGSLYNGVWYAPAGNSYIAQLLEQAKTSYLWKNTSGTGSLSLDFETVFTQAEQAEIWIAPGMAKNRNQLITKNKHYQQLTPFINNKIYSYANTTGPTGGLLFFEQGALRPDLILKDLVKIAHPELLQGYEMTFFKRLD